MKITDPAAEKITKVFAPLAARIDRILDRRAAGCVPRPKSGGNNR